MVGVVEDIRALDMVSDMVLDMAMVDVVDSGDMVDG